MTATVVWSLVSVVLVSLVSLIGLATLSMDEARIRRFATFFVSFAVGALLGDAFIHLLPEAFADRSGATVTPSLLVLGGMLIFFIVEKLMRHEHGPIYEHFHGHPTIHHPEVAAINIVGDAIHNSIDGVLIGASYLANTTLGISTTIAVLLHEVPHELGNFGILVHSGLSIRQAVLLNLASASTAVLGTVGTLLVGAHVQEGTVHALLPITAGAFVYLAAADLIPELQHDRSLSALVVQTSLIAVGIAVMATLKFLE